jgi:energy-coupling factor transporter transmembrane protein EcfT
MVFQSVNDVDLPVFLLLMVGYSKLKIDTNMPENYLGYIWAMIFICFFLNFSFNPTPRILMVMAAFALPLIFILGHKYGSRLALRAGVILGCIAALGFRLSDSFYWGGINTDFILGAPLIGYLGGTDFVKKDFLANGMKIFGAYYGAVLIASIMTYGFDLASRADDLLNIGFSLALLLFLSLYSQKPE